MKHLLLWDGDCGVCARCAAWLQKRDHRHLFEIVPHQSKNDIFLANVGLIRADCNREIQLVTSDGKNLGGAEAFNFFLEKYPPWSWLVRIMRRSFLLLVMEKSLYRLIAARRASLSEWLGMTACSRM